MSEQHQNNTIKTKIVLFDRLIITTHAIALTSQISVTTSLHCICRKDQAPSWIFCRLPVKMPHTKKWKDSDVKVPNYSKHEYAERIQTFIESKKLLETELNIRVLWRVQTRGALDNFIDTILNDHLYTMYKRKRLKTPVLMRKLVGFFVC